MVLFTDLEIIRKVTWTGEIVPGIELLKCLELLIDESDKDVFCYVNEEPFGKPLGNVRVGPVCQKNQSCDTFLIFLNQALN